MKYFERYSHILSVILVLCYCSTLSLMGQLVAHDIDGKATTIYPNPQNKRDTIFAYNQIPNPKKGHLSFSTTNSSDFQWFQFDYIDKIFPNKPFHTDFNTTQTEVSLLEPGGYKIKVLENNIVVDSVVCWIYFNSGFNLKLLKDDKGAVIFTGKSCGYTDFEIDPATPVKTSTFTYYNPSNTQSPYQFSNTISFTIKPDGGSTSKIDLKTMGSEQYFRWYNPPSQDTNYEFQGTDMFSITNTDKILYETIVPKADMTTVLPEEDPQSAPVDVGFINKSVNAFSFTWKFGDKDNVAKYTLDNLPDTVKYIYYTPTTYEAMLIVESANGCADSVSVKITVDDSHLDVPNVFTPNGDGIHDYFKVDNTSIREFEIFIYSRTGIRIYHFKGDNLRNWEGWNGQYKGKDVPEGVYFFTIRAIGWDEPEKKYGYNKKSEFTGSVHLYR